MIEGVRPPFQYRVAFPAKHFQAFQMPKQSNTGLLAFLALIVGAIAMGASPIFVRFAEVGPFTSAFWRVALALPALWLWARMEAPPGNALQMPGEGADRPARIDRATAASVILAGVFFSGDLIFWHLAIVNTSVANATFMAVLAPVWVALGSGLFLGERVDRKTVIGLGLCLAGATALIGESLSLRPQQVIGDIYGFITSFFFGAYFLAVRRARRVLGTGRMLFWSSLVTAALLLAAAQIAEDRMWPSAAVAVAALLALALVSHTGGQGLLAFALGHLPAAFSALVIFLEAVAAAGLGWLILGEALGLVQALGALAILAGIAAARPRRPPVGGP
jgi:drug/metabolite transporter (DMT)-like permease